MKNEKSNFFIATLQSRLQQCKHFFKMLFFRVKMESTEDNLFAEVPKSQNTLNDNSENRKGDFPVLI